MTEKNIEAFWSRFNRESNNLRMKIRNGDLRSAFDQIERLLGSFGFDFVFELTEEEDNAVLILTPEGDHEVAFRIDNFLAVRPPIDGWLFYGRRQRKNIDDAIVFIRHIYGVDISNAKFSIRKWSNNYEITLVSPIVEELSSDETQGLVATLMDHAVGEDTMMKRAFNLKGISEVKEVSCSLLSLQELVASFEKYDLP